MFIVFRYYFYDSVACSNGVTASGPCSAETILTSSNTHMLTRSNMLFTAIGPRVDTPVITGSDTKLSNYTFCATPTSTATAKLDQVFRSVPSKFYDLMNCERLQCVFDRAQS